MKDEGKMVYLIETENVNHMGWTAMAIMADFNSACQSIPESEFLPLVGPAHKADTEVKQWSWKDPFGYWWYITKWEINDTHYVTNKLEARELLHLKAK